MRNRLLLDLNLLLDLLKDTHFNDPNNDFNGFNDYFLSCLSLQQISHILEQLKAATLLMASGQGQGWSEGVLLGILLLCRGLQKCH